MSFPATARSAMSTTSSASRRPFGKPARSPPKTPSRFGLAVGGGPIARLRATLPLAGPLMVSLVTEAERRAIALDARAFHARGARTSLTEVADPNGERRLRAVMWILTVLLVVWGFVR